jgi:GntR family transcriptional regulator
MTGERTSTQEAEDEPRAGLRLTRSSEGTLHSQIYRTLANSIRNGEVKPGDQLPTENELMSVYSVSRSTARRALDELRREELVDRAPGKGTFVAMPKIRASIPNLHSITAEIEQLGYRAGSKLIAVAEGRADAAVAAKLGLAEDDAVLFLKRLRTADDRPFYFAESILNSTAFPRLLTTDYTSPSLSLYRLFEEVAGRRVQRVTQWLSAVGAMRAVARHLDVGVGSPLLQLERVLFVEGDVPIELVTAWFIGGSYKYYSELTPGGQIARAKALRK